MYVTILIVKSGKNISWYVDKRTTHHMAYDKNSFITYKIWERGWVFFTNNMTHDKFGQVKVAIQLKNGRIIPYTYFIYQV